MPGSSQLGISTESPTSLDTGRGLFAERLAASPTWEAMGPGNVPGMVPGVREERPADHAAGAGRPADEGQTLGTAEALATGAGLGAVGALASGEGMGQGCEVMGVEDPALVLRDVLQRANRLARPARRGPGAGLGAALRTTLPFVLADALALALAGWLAAAALALVGVACPVAAAAPFLLLPLLGAYALGALYSEVWVHPVVEFRQLTLLTTAGVWVEAVAGGVLVPAFLPWCLAGWPLALVLVPLLRTLARRCCVNCRWWGYPTLVIGSGDGAARLAALLLEVPRSGLRPCLVTDPDARCLHAPLPVVNDPAELEQALRRHGVLHAVVALPDFSVARCARTLDRYSGLLPHLLVLSDASTLPSLWGASRSSGRLSGIEVRNGRLLWTLRALKRAIDLVVALAALALALPLMLLIAALVKLTSRGTLFFGQTRLGQHGRPFTAWKFRTMRPNADAVLRQYLQAVATAQEEWSRDHKLRLDPRVTWFGRFLRRTSLDELPQLWNVVRGEMSLVGPRPIVQGEVSRYGDIFPLYTSVKPGITGLWQVSGRNDVDYADRVRLDEFYVRHWSPWLDLYILAKTLVVLVDGEGAY